MFACLYCYFQNVASFSIVAQNSPGSMIFPEFQQNNFLKINVEKKETFVIKNFRKNQNLLDSQNY